MYGGKIMLVYRVEHKKDGMGPYRSYEGGSFVRKMKDKHNDSDYHKTPNSEFHRNKSFYMEEDMYCGFNSIKSLKIWFKGFRAAMRKNKYVLKVYKAPSKNILCVGSETGQVVFYRDECKLLKVKEIP